MKRICLIIAIAAVPLLAISSGTARAAVIGNSDGSYDVMMASVYFHYQPNGMIAISQFGVSTGNFEKNVIFSLIEGGPFEPTEAPIQNGRTVTISGQKAHLEAHDNAHATLVYRSTSTNDVIFSLATQIGAVVLGSRAYLGDSKIQADLSVTSDNQISKSVDNLIVHLEPEDSAVFRIHGPAGSLGTLLSSGLIAAELDVRTNGVALDPDLTVYNHGSSIEVESIGSNRASFTYSGMGSDEMYILDIDQQIFEGLKNDMKILVSGSEIQEFPSVEELMNRDSPGYYVGEGGQYSEMIVRPGSASGSLIIESAPPTLNPLLVISGIASVFVTIMSAVYLFRRRGQ